MLKFSTFEELLENEGLKKKAAKSGVSLGTLKKVYNRGMAAWRTGHRPGTTPQQWGMARVNSYIGKGKGTYYGADSDLSGKGKKSKKESVGEARVTSTAFRAKTSMVNPMVKKNISDMGKKYKGNTSGFMNAVKKKYPDEHKSDIVKNMYKKHAETNEAAVKEISKSTLGSYIKKADMDKSRKHARSDLGMISKDDAYKNQVKRNKGIELAKAKMKPAKVSAEATVKEISKGLAMRYIGKAARDVYHKGQQQGADDAISRLGGPTKPYKKSPERKAAKRVAGIDRATKITSMRPLSYPIGRQGDLKRLKKNEAKRVVHSDKPDSLKSIKVITPKTKKNEATTSDAERKAIDDFIKKGKMKKLKPGFAQGYHGKADPGAGMKGMISPADTKQFGTKKKIGSMK